MKLCCEQQIRRRRGVQVDGQERVLEGQTLVLRCDGREGQRVVVDEVHCVEPLLRPEPLEDAVWGLDRLGRVIGRVARPKHY